MVAGKRRKLRFRSSLSDGEQRVGRGGRGGRGELRLDVACLPGLFGRDGVG